MPINYVPSAGTDERASAALFSPISFANNRTDVASARFSATCECVCPEEKCEFAVGIGDLNEG